MKKNGDIGVTEEVTTCVSFVSYSYTTYVDTESTGTGPRTDTEVGVDDEGSSA